jgi:DeoR family fructose operon transcriptional repressor
LAASREERGGELLLSHVSYAVAEDEGEAMKSHYIPADRQDKIHKLVHNQGIVKVAELSAMLHVSEITIRRDLDVLEKKGILERTYGGAVYSNRMIVEPPFFEKDRIHRIEKEAIGRAASELIDEGDTVLVNSGSTSLQVIRYLSGKRAQIITSNVGAHAVVSNVRTELILIGGNYRSQSNSLVGSLASQSLEQVYGSKAIIGVDGISVKYGLTTPVLQEAEIARMMIDRTRGPVIVVADHSKLGVVSNFVTAPIEKVNILVTDDGFEQDFRDELEKLGIMVVIGETAGR